MKIGDDRGSYLRFTSVVFRTFCTVSKLCIMVLNVPIIEKISNCGQGRTAKDFL